MANDNVVDQIKAQVDNARARLAMLVGSALEGGWGPSFNTGDAGHSRGPFQINDLYHRDISATDAEDPAKAVSYMRGAYLSAVAQVPDSLWGSNPELAAQDAAQLAERPARPYNLSEGQAAVDAAYGKSQKALAGGGGHWYDYLNPVTDVQKAVGGIVDKGTDAAGNAIGGAVGAVWNDAKPFLLTMAFAGLGLGLIAIGGFQATKGRADKAMQQLQITPPPAAGGAPGGGGKGAAGGAGAAAGESALPEAAALAAV